MGESWWARQNPPHPSTPRESRFILFLPGPLWLALLIIPENLAGKVTGSPRARVWTKLVNEKRNTGLWGTALVWFKSGGKKRMWREEAEALMATAVHQSPWSCSRRLLTTRVRQLNCGHLYPRISHSHIQTLQWPFHYPSLPTGKLKPRGVSSRWNFQKARVGSSSAPPPPGVFWTARRKWDTRIHPQIHLIPKLPQHFLAPGCTRYSLGSSVFVCPKLFSSCWLVSTDPFPLQYLCMPQSAPSLEWTSELLACLCTHMVSQMTLAQSHQRENLQPRQGVRSRGEMC